MQSLNWHVDLAADARDRLTGIQAFFLIDDVAPHGGATLLLAGSHRVDRRTGPGRRLVRDVLKTCEDPQRELQALGLSVVELSGRAGDVVLMDMRVLHTPSINTTANVRMMATARCFLAH